MKKVLLFLPMALLCLGLSAQDKTVTRELKTGESYISVALTAADTITSAMDSVDYRIKYVGGYVNKVTVHAELDKRTTTDSVTVALLGYDCLDDATGDVIIAATVISVTGSSIDLVLTDDYASAADEFSFRYYRIRIIRTGHGGGVVLKELELKLYGK